VSTKIKIIFGRSSWAAQVELGQKSTRAHKRKNPQDIFPLPARGGVRGGVKPEQVLKIFNFSSFPILNKLHQPIEILVCFPLSPSPDPSPHGEGKKSFGLAPF